jgi:two-component sensor histidine kinase
MADDLPNHPAVTDSLALALVASSDAPVLLLDKDLIVVAASASFSRTFKIDPNSINGRPLFELGAGEWDVAQLRSFLRATLLGGADLDAYEMDLKRPGSGARRLVLTAHRLNYADQANERLLLTLSDVTDARLSERLKDDLLREKGILFQELQHRVANSLQIIASVLMLSARRVSAESRGHLQDAHSRVMSVATLQQQLAESRLGDVKLRPYFTELCASIGASMIHDRETLTLSVEADDGVATADASVSLGLIVTELVINALKHAFPDARGGKILVSYRSDGADWTLSVRDDGVGIPRGAEPVVAGLGTSIVEALAKQLNATVDVANTHPGATISIVHNPSVSVAGPVPAIEAA